MKKSWAVVFAILLTTVAGAELPATSEQLSSSQKAPEEATVAPDQDAKDTPPLTEETASSVPSPKEESPEQEPEKEPDETPANQVCLPVAFVDIDQAFNEHPRTVAIKAQIHEKILAKEREVAQAKEDIETRRRENIRLTALGSELKPFYEHIVIEPHPLLPRIEESTDSLVLHNLLNRLTFAQTTVLTASPLDTPAQLEDITARITENSRIIEKRSVFIDNYKYTTREEILKLEQKEVQEILQDIYQEMKSFAKKRNIGAIVRKEELLYGEKPVNVTQDFINRLKKSRKYRKRGK